MTTADSTLTIVLVYPDLLGTYGDRGNLLALQHRSRARGLPVRVVEVDPGDRVPSSADLYVLGGGEDGSQLLAAEALFAERGFRAALATARQSDGPTLVRMMIDQRSIKTPYLLEDPILLSAPFRRLVGKT